MKDIEKYLPLTESTFYILLTMTLPVHGYAVMQQVESMSEGTVQLGPGTLYGAIDTLGREGFIQPVEERDRRKYYRLTGRGIQLLEKQIQRNAIQHRLGQQLLRKIVKESQNDG